MLKHLIISLLLIAPLSTAVAQSSDMYLDPNQSIELRVKDLLSRMTLKEKVAQMNIPVVGRLGKDMHGKSQRGSDKVDNFEEARRFIAGTYNEHIGPGGGLFTPAFLNLTAREQAAFANELQRIALDTRLKIPALFIEEGTHGLMASSATVFPEGLALGSSFNMDLVEKVFAANARETRAIGSHEICTVVIEPNRDPRLGRNMEGFSEDPMLCAQIAEAIVAGAQGTDITAEDKVIVVFCHYPGQGGTASGLERNAVMISERELREIYLPPWVAGIKKAGALGVMAMHPAVDGDSPHASEFLLNRVLREELGFKGLVVSEGRGIGTILRERIVATRKEAAALGVKAGVDVNISSYPEYMDLLIDNVNEGHVSMETIDLLVGRILRIKFQLGLFEKNMVDPDQAARIVNSQEHKDLALQAAREGIVLLKNGGNILPLSKKVKSIAVIGPNADNGLNQLGDYFRKPVTQHIVTVLEGIKATAPGAKINYVKGCKVFNTDLNEIKQAVDAARKSEVAIVVLGENERNPSDDKGTDGEGNDMASLDLTGLQQELVQAVQATGTPTVVVLINGRPLSTRWIADNIPAIVEAWVPGEQGGTAIAEVLFGNYNPGGHLAITIPRHVGQLPMYYNHFPPKVFTGRGYVDMPATPLYPFGHGLSYTNFEYSNLQVSPQTIKPAGNVTITADITNTGTVAGDEVVQLYRNDVVSSVVTPVTELKGFEKIHLEPGQKITVTFTLTPDDLSFLDLDLHPIVEPGDFDVMVGRSSADIRLTGSFSVEE
jgi:beta-glucosidase